MSEKMIQKSLPLLVLSAFLAVSQGSCPPGAIQGLDERECYAYGVSAAASWLDADAECARMGGSLASISNAMENTLVGDFPNMGLLEEYWLGGMFIGRIQGWTWADGRPLCYANWANGQPRNESGVCVAFASVSRRWYARDCKAEKPFICKLSEQKTAGTPESESCAEGWAYVNGTSKCYKVVIAFNKEAHDTLWDKCKKIGGKVASIHSVEENAALTAFVNGSITQEFRKEIQWFVFGLYSADGGLNWQWKDGSRVDYVNWAPDMPRTLRDTKQKCVAVTFDGGPEHSRWGDDHCTAASEWSAAATLCMRNPRH